MKPQSYSRLSSLVVGVLVLVITASALFSLAQVGLPVSIPTLPDGPILPKVPHPACPTCFTYVCPDCYTIFEEISGTGVTLPRQIPNPAPLEPGEEREVFDVETGLPIWYIGHQGYVGPTDEEPFSPAYPVPLIALKRIDLREQGAIFSIPGVHSFGIGEVGFVVYLDPEHRQNQTLIPQAIQGVPVEVKIAKPFEPVSHWLTTFKPVPSGVTVGAKVFVPRVGQTANTVATLGPHIVRYTSEVRIHSLTAGHALKLLDAPVSPVAVHQPTPALAGARQWGTLIHGFQLTPCDILTDTECASSVGPPVNNTWERPDIAVIQNITPADPSPHTSPANSDEPIRRLQYGENKYINGPSGILITPEFGASAKMWGAISGDNPPPSPSQPHAPTGSVAEIVTSVVPSDSVEGKIRKFKIRYLCVINLERDAEEGDSGALVSGNGTGNRHVFGVMFGRSQQQHTRGTFILAQDIKTALTNSGFSFDHFWGTASGYRPPAVTQCDGSC